MATKPKISIGATKRSPAEEQDFRFSEENMRLTPRSEKISAYRRAAFEVYQQLPFPDTKQEAWRRTDLRGLQPRQFAFPANGYHNPVPGSLSKEDEQDRFAGRVLVTPGGSEISLDASLQERGVVFTDLRTAEQWHPHLLEQALGSAVRPEEGKFAALAGAFAQNGVFLYVPENVIVEQPLESLLASPNSDQAFITHTVIFLDKGASVTLFHECLSSEETGRKLHAGIVETLISERASLKFVEIQAWDEQVWNFTHERVRVGAAGNLDWIIGALGSRLTKSFMDLDLVGQGATGRVSGFSFTNQRQHLDYDTQQNHLVAHTTSDLLYKVALTDHSRSVWQGMIYVAPGAEKTDGYQSNRNLLLSPTARADSIPGLEILADDVRCTHGATIGELDYEQIFYMMARGIPRRVAERLLVEGFFDPIMQRIPFDNVRARFQSSISTKLNLT